MLYSALSAVLIILKWIGRILQEKARLILWNVQNVKQEDRGYISIHIVMMKKRKHNVWKNGMKEKCNTELSTRINIIRLYEEGETLCECKDCQAMNKLKSDIDTIYTRVPIDMPFELQELKSHARRLHDAKVLENAQKLKNLESCQKCKNELVACVCMEVD